MLNKRVATTAERLKEAMDAAGKRQADLVRETGLDRSSISNYLAGTYEPKSDAVGKLARALNVGELWLWGFDVPRDKTETQKKNDKLAQLIVQLRKNPELFDVVISLSELSPADFASIKQIILSLGNK